MPKVTLIPVDDEDGISVSLTPVTEDTKPSFVRDVVLQSLKDTAGAITKAGAGVVQGATLGAINPEEGTVGIPFTDIKTKVAPPLAQSLENTVGVSPEIARNQYIGIAPSMAGTAGPWGATSKLIQAGGTTLRALKAGKALAPVTETVGNIASQGANGSAIIRAGHQAATGAVIGAAEVRNKNDSILDNILNTAALGAGMSLLGDGIHAIIKATGLSREGAYLNLKKELTDLIYRSNYRNYTPEQSAKAADIVISQELSKAGIETPTAKQMRQARKNVKDIKKNVEAQAQATPAEPAEPKAPPQNMGEATVVENPAIDVSSTPGKATPEVVQEPPPAPAPAPTMRQVAEAQGIIKEGEVAKQEYIAKLKAESEAQKTPAPGPVVLTPVSEEVQTEMPETSATLPATETTEVTARNSPVSTAQLEPNSEINTAAHEAATSPTNNIPEPTIAQQEAGNYKKGHVNYQGLDISIENPAGSSRKGIDEYGNNWETELTHHYGYIKGTTGKDGDHVDVFIPPDVDPKSDKVFVVDQKDSITNSFDEHKVMLGFDSKEKAREGYLDNYDDSGKDRIMNITEMSVGDFKDWLKDGDQKKPATQYFKPRSFPQNTEVDTHRPKPQSEIVQSGASSQETQQTQAGQGFQAINSIPETIIADFVKKRLDEGESLTKKELWDTSDKAFGGKKSEGKYTPKDAYDAMEMGINQYIAGVKEVDIRASVEDAKDTVSALKLLVDRVPTQTTRTEEQNEFQQFSTPPPLAYTVNWAANIGKGDIVLEPSAGIGGIATFAKGVADKVHVNELSPRRKAILEQMGFDRVFGENAEQIHNILPKDIKPSVVVMNPPFSSTAGRKQGERKTMNATLHINQSLSRLEDGGRLVAIVGEGMAEGKPTFNKWWNDIKKAYNVRANIGINGNEYKKYGTTFGNQILVIDKTGPTAGKTLTGQVDKIEDLIPLLKEIRNDRGNITTKQEVAEPSGKKGNAKPEVSSGTEQPVRSSTGDSGDGKGVSRGPGGSSGRQDINGTSGKLVEGKTENSNGQAVRDNPGKEPTGTVKNGTEEPSSGNSGSIQRTSDGTKPELRTGKDTGEVSGGITTKVTERTEKSTGDVNKVNVETKEAETNKKEKNPDAIFDEYQVQRINIPGAKKHPGALVESAAMAAVKPPAASYSPSISKEAIKAGNISMAQLEPVVYAGQAHEEMLPSGERKGYFIGDGTGVGKGREIASIMWDNWNKGRKKAVWISKNSPLVKDARRDVKNVGWNPDVLFDIQKVKPGKQIGNSDGIGFVGYSTLVNRVDQIAEWLGEDFDGVIAFDEAHLMGNAIDIKEGRHTKKASKRALAGLELQLRLPKARIVYVSATGATEVKHLSYAQRIGLWGKDTPFSSVKDFVNQISAGGIAVMEVVARDMKQMGVYLSRSLSYKGVGYERLEHNLTPDQQEAYDEMSEAWQLVLKSFDGALAQTGGVGNSTAKKNAKGAFWTSNQRFWNQIVTSMQMPSVIKAIEKDLAEGFSPVLQFTNTNEAALNRAIARMEEEDTIEDLDLSPKDVLINLIKDHYPTQQYQEITDENGNTQWVPVVDSQGVAVENADAVAARDELIMKIGGLKRVPEGPLDTILNHFGTDQVAEVTGRTKRVVEKDTPEGRRRVMEKWSEAKSTVDAEAFQNDKKKILLFSDAGGTGRSYHADLDAANQRLRRHYVIQPGWRADAAVQGLGRSHRTNEKQPPQYVLVTTDLPGHKRFVSSIARRLDQLGALTKGQKTAGSQGLFAESDNLESSFATAALEDAIMSIARGTVENIPAKEFTKQSGLEILDDYGQPNLSKFPDIPQFLNRLLNMKKKMQEDVFDIFSTNLDARIAKAKEEGRSMGGLETIQAKRTETLSDQVVYTDPKTGGETRYLSIDLVKDAKLLTFENSDQYAKGGYFKNVKSGRVWATGKQRTVQTSSGSLKTIVPAVGPGYSGHNILLDEIQDKEKYISLSRKEAQKLWDKEFQDTPQEMRQTIHLITGLTLPIWDRLPQGEARIFRVMTDKGPVIGRKINPTELKRTLDNLGASSSSASVKDSPKEIYDSILEQNSVVTLVNGWKMVRRKVQGEHRIEVLDIDYGSAQNYRSEGLYPEQISYQTRWFVPTEKGKAENLISAITKSKPVVAIDSGNPIGNQRGSIDLHILGVPQVVNATKKLLNKINPKAANNISVKQAKNDLGFVKAALLSPGMIPGKARYYVVHGKNAVLKQERLRGIVKEKMSEIFGPLNNDEVSELAALEWLGDANGVNYTQVDLNQAGVSAKVQTSYLAHRKFHEQVWRLLRAHRKSFGLNVEGMAGREGHVPHIFENWNVYEMVDDPNGGPRLPAGIVGTFRSLKQATDFANSLDPQKEYMIKPKTFRLPDDMISKTVLKDSSYFKMVDNLEKTFGVTKDEAHKLIKDVARLKGRHRFLGNLMKRKGQTGHRVENIGKIFQEYYHGVARYIAMDDFKARTVPKFERDFGVELGRGNQAIRDKNTALYIEDYINDLNGVPGKTESYLNASIMASPFFAKHVSTQRPSVWITNKLMHVTGVLKLGLFNLSSGMVNLTQLVNTFSKIPGKQFAGAFGKVISHQLSGSDKALLRRLGVDYDLGLTDTGGYSAIHKGNAAVEASLYFFRKAEYLNRAISGLAAYRTAQAKGMSKEECRIFARQVIDKTQFDYSVADTSMIFRNPIGRFFGQFKPYAIKQIEFITGLKGAENIKFWIPMLLFAGTAGIPLVEGASDLIEWITGANPLTETKEFLMKWAGDDKDKKAVARVAMYGVGSILGIDASRRVGTGDALPKKPADLLGPTINTLMSAKKIMETGDKSEFVKSLAPSVGNLLTAIEAIQNNMQVTDPYRRDRLKYEADFGDVIAKTTGFRPVRESELADVQNIAKYKGDKYTNIQKKHVDKAIEALRRGDAEGFAESITNAAEKGVIIDDKVIKREILQKALPQNIRLLLSVRNIQKANQMELYNYLESDGKKIMENTNQ